MKNLNVAVLTASLFTVGCASSSENISASYVSPLQYQSYTCEQLTEEMQRVGRKAREVAGVQDSEADKDAVAMGVGLVLFWPALFFLIGDDRKEELARLKGEVEAIEQSAIKKDCKTLLANVAKEREAAKKRSAAKKNNEEKKAQE